LGSFASVPAPDRVDVAGVERSDAGLRARRQVIGAQRVALAELQDSDQISSRAARDIEDALDLEEREYS
jgi:hypothetical protein